MMRAVEQGPKQASIQDWNIHEKIRLLTVKEVRRA